MELLDRVLVKLITEAVNVISKDSEVVTAFFKRRSKELGIKDDYVRKIVQGNLSWKTFLQGLVLLEMTDIFIDIKFKYKVDKDNYSKDKRVSVPITNIDQRQIGHYSLRDITDAMLDCVASDGLHQTIFVNKTRYYFTKYYPNLSSKAVEDKTRNLLRRLQSTSFSWSTFMELLCILEVKDSTLCMTGTIGKEKFKSTTMKINEVGTWMV